MSSRDDRRDDELEERLDELEDVLSELRRDLRETDRDRRGPPRPPNLSELLRFTEQYTIPTVIALLETTIKSLELLRGTLRLADPGRSVADDAGAASDRLADVRDGASAGLARSLSELRTALSEADLPEEAASRSIIAEARDLTAEIESRIEEGRREADAARRSGRRDDRGSDRGRDVGSRRTGDGDEGRGRDADPSGRDRGIRIDVSDPDTEPAADAPGDDAEDDSTPEVDVESELESIKRQIDGDEVDAADGDAADGEPGDSADSGPTDSDAANSDSADSDAAIGDAAEGDAENETQGDDADRDES